MILFVHLSDRKTHKGLLYPKANATLDTIRADTARSTELETLLMEKLGRWDALESRAKGNP